MDDHLLAMAAHGLAGEVAWGEGTKPASYPADITVLELFVHGWDVARALDRPFEPSEQLVHFADGVVHRVVTDEARSTGRFDPAVVVAPDAPAIDRVVAWTGRDPSRPTTG